MHPMTQCRVSPDAARVAIGDGVPFDAAQGTLAGRAESDDASAQLGPVLELVTQPYVRTEGRCVLRACARASSRRDSLLTSPSHFSGMLIHLAARLRRPHMPCTKACEALRARIARTTAARMRTTRCYAETRYAGSESWFRRCATTVGAGLVLSALGSRVCLSGLELCA